MPKVIRISSVVNESLLMQSYLDTTQLENTVRHDLIQQLARGLYDAEVKTQPGICGTVYYIELNIVSNNELEILEKAMK